MVIIQKIGHIYQILIFNQKITVFFFLKFFKIFLSDICNLIIILNIKDFLIRIINPNSIFGGINCHLQGIIIFVIIGYNFSCV